MKKLFIILFIFIFFILFSEDLTSDYIKINYLPKKVNALIFEKEILNNIINIEDKNYIRQFYYRGIAKINYYMKLNQKKEDLLKVYNLINSYKATNGFLATEKAKYLHENENPVFLQKGGMLRSLDHSFYLRTDDEWTGFSTLFFGYRFGVTEYFNFAFEGGIGLPQVYIASTLLHFKIYETPKKFFFIGLRGRIGYKFQNAEKSLFIYDKNTGKSLGYLGLGKNYLTIQNRHCLYFATDLTIAFRLGRLKNICLYYTIFPKFDFDLQGKQTYVLFSPVMVGYEVRFGNRMDWTFAVEAGYTFPLPWGSIPDGEWINFPSLANVSLNYRFGDKFYWKKNIEKIYNDAIDKNETN